MSTCVWIKYLILKQYKFTISYYFSFMFPWYDSLSFESKRIKKPYDLSTSFRKLLYMNQERQQFLQTFQSKQWIFIFTDNLPIFPYNLENFGEQLNKFAPKQRSQRNLIRIFSDSGSSLSDFFCQRTRIQAYCILHSDMTLAERRSMFPIFFIANSEIEKIVLYKNIFL